MKTNIIVRIQIEGLHVWPDAKFVQPDVSFLSNIHRHIFYIELKKRVNHDDRDVEFIVFKRQVEEYLKNEYYRNDYRTHFFGNRSCEMIAKELLKKFDCVYVSVFEDNENGAECYEE